MDYLVLQNLSVANDAKRKIEANFLRYRSDWQDSRGFGKPLKNLSGGDVDPTDKTDAELLDTYDLVMVGQKNGAANVVDGFTTEWSGIPRQRLDGKWCIELPEEGDLRNALLFSVPQPNSVETDDGSWF